MQPTLFGAFAVEPSAPRRESGPTERRRARETTETELEQTLFEPVESRAQARQRAQRMVQLHAAINDAPEAIASCRYHGEILDYFIARSANAELDPNDRDGLLRLVGAIQFLLSEDDCQQMREKQEIWRPYPRGWIGARDGDMYAAALHPKEIAYLRQLQEQAREEERAISESMEQWKDELLRLKGIGPLPEKIAERYALTIEGDPIKRRADFA